MGSIIGHRIVFNRVGVITERPATHTQQNIPQEPPPPQPPGQ